MLTGRTRLLWILSCGAVAATFGFLVSASFPRLYRAEAVVERVTLEGSMLRAGNGIGALIGRVGVGRVGGAAPLAGQEESLSSIVATLRSRAFLMEFIEEQGILSELVEGGAASEPSEQARRLARERAYRYFVDRILTVLTNSEHDLLRVRIEWRDRFAAAEWANALVERINEATKRRTLENADKSVLLTQAELTRATGLRGRQGAYLALESALQRKMLANSRPDYPLSTLDPARAADEDHFIWPVPALGAFLFGIGGAVVGMLASGVTSAPRREMA